MVSVKLPEILNIDLSPFDQVGGFLSIDTCDRWFLYQFDDHIQQNETLLAETRDFWGYNNGTEYSEEGLLSRDNIL
jgi:hypothetical protein